MMITKDALPWREEPRMRIGHYAFTVILPVCIAAFITRDLIGYPEGGIGYLFDFFMLLWCYSVFADMTVHSRHLCERCARKTPLDPQRAITRWRLALLGFHRGVLHAAVIGVFGWIAVTVIIFRSPHWPYWAYTTDAGVWAFIAVVLFGSYKHSRLQPWCPYCRWGDGGVEEQVPDPDPALELT